MAGDALSEEGAFPDDDLAGRDALLADADMATGKTLAGQRVLTLSD